MDLIDPAQYMSQAAQPGEMVYAQLATGLVAPFETALLIRDTPRNIAAFGRDPAVQLRGGLMFDGQVALIATLLQVGAGRAAQLYECWWNWHADGNRQSFLDLATQTHLSLVFFDPAPVKVVRVENAYRAMFANLARTAPRAWSMAEFDAARQRVFEAYPDALALWREFGRQHAADRRTEVARLAGVDVSQVQPVSASLVKAAYADRAASIVIEVATQSPARYWQVGNTCYLDDPEFGPVVAVDDLDYQPTLGLHVRRSA